MNGINALFLKDLVCVNVGVDIFADAIEQQNSKCIQVSWKPTAGGDLELIRILNWIED